jgi:hypothetical protein
MLRTKIGYVSYQTLLSTLIFASKAGANSSGVDNTNAWQSIGKHSSLFVHSVFDDPIE